MPKNLTNEQRSKVLWYLQQHKNPANKNGLKRGALESAAIDFQVSPKTVKRVSQLSASLCLPFLYFTIFIFLFTFIIKSIQSIYI